MYRRSVELLVLCVIVVQYKGLFVNIFFSFPFVVSFALPDVDECSSGAATCDVNARCQNTVGSYNCTCKEGFPGDGKRCTGKYQVYTL